MALTEQILIRMGLDGTKLDTGLRKSEGKIKAFAKVAKGALASVGLVFGAASVIRGINSLRQLADDISTRAAVLGVGAEFLQRFAYAAEQTGVNSQKATVALEKLVQKVGLANTVGGEYAKIFETFGIRTDGKTIEEILFDVSDIMAAMPDQMQKNALAMKLFEEGGAALVSTLQLSSEGVKLLMAEAVALSDVQIQAIDRADKALKRGGLGIKVWAGKQLSSILRGSDEISGQDAGVGRRFADAWASGNLGGLWAQGAASQGAFGGEESRGLSLDRQLVALNAATQARKQQVREDKAARREKDKEAHNARVEAHEKRVTAETERRAKFIKTRMTLVNAYNDAISDRNKTAYDRRRFTLGGLLTQDPTTMNNAEFAQFQKAETIAGLEDQSRWAALVGNETKSKGLRNQALELRKTMTGLTMADQNPYGVFEERAAEAVEALRGHVESGGLPVRATMGE